MLPSSCSIKARKRRKLGKLSSGWETKFGGDFTRRSWRNRVSPYFPAELVVFDNSFPLPLRDRPLPYDEIDASFALMSLLISFRP